MIANEVLSDTYLSHVSKKPILDSYLRNVSLNLRKQSNLIIIYRVCMILIALSRTTDTKRPLQRILQLTL